MPIAPELVDKPIEPSYNKRKEAHPLVRVWIGQLLNSEELQSILGQYGEKQIDVTLYSSHGKVVLGPKVSVR